MNELKNLCKRLAELKKNQLALDILEEFSKLAANAEQYFELAESYSEVCASELAIKLAEKALVSTNSNQAGYQIRTFLARLYLNTNQPAKAMAYININKKINPTAELQYLAMLAKESNG